MRKALLSTAVVLLSAYVLLPWLYAGYLTVDQAETLYHARSLLAGKVPYGEMFSHHFLGYILPFSFVGLFLELHPPVIWAMSLTFHLLSVLLIFQTLQALADKKAAWCGAFFAASAGWLPGWTGDTFNVQNYFLPIFYALILCITQSTLKQSSRWYAAGGLVFGALITFDQRLVLAGVLFSLPPLYSPSLRKWNTLGLAALAAAFTPAVFLLYFWRQGVLIDFFQQTIIFPLFYRNKGIDVSTVDYFSTMFAAAVKLEPFVVCAGVFALLLLLLYERRRFVLLLLGFLLLIGIFYVLIGGRFFPHYLMIFAPFTLLIIPLGIYRSREAWRLLERFFLFCVLLSVLYVLIRPVYSWNAGGSFFKENKDEDIKEIAHCIDSMIPVGEQILVWGYQPKIYLYANRFTDFREMGLIAVTGANFSSEKEEEQGIMPEMLTEFKNYLRDTPPAAVVTYRLVYESSFGSSPVQANMEYERLAHLRYFKDFLARQYRKLRNIPLETANIEIFLRLDLEEAGFQPTCPSLWE